MKSFLTYACLALLALPLSTPAKAEQASTAHTATTNAPVESKEAQQQREKLRARHEALADERAKMIQFCRAAVTEADHAKCKKMDEALKTDIDNFQNEQLAIRAKPQAVPTTSTEQSGKTK